MNQDNSRSANIVSQQDEQQGATPPDAVQSRLDKDYEFGFVSKVDSDILAVGLSEDVVRKISAIKDEPSWLLDFRLKAYRYWQKMPEPNWASFAIPAIDYQKISYFAQPKKSVASLDEIDPEVIKTFEKLGIPLKEQEVLLNVKGAPRVAVDAIFDSVSVATTFREELAKVGVVFCAFSEAVKHYPELVKKYLGSVVPYSDNKHACLNSAVFSDGSFVYIPRGVKCPMELSTYFRINAENTGQFERTLIIADEAAEVSYLEGCTAPMRDENQLHAAVVELVALDDASIKYSTVQNWYPGDKMGRGGIYNFVTKRGACRGARSHISWTQVETGSAITWKYPSCILQGDYSSGEFYSVAISNNYQKADTGTKMIHLGKHTKSRIISKGIVAGHGHQAYRGLLKIAAKAEGAQNFTQCDSLIIGDAAIAETIPYIENNQSMAKLEHEATTTSLSEEQIFYCQQRGIDKEQAVGLIVNGFCREVLQNLPMEFAVEAQKLVAISLEGAVG